MLNFKMRTPLMTVKRSSLCQCIGILMLSAVCSYPANAEWTGGIEGGTVVSGSGNATRLRLVLRNDERPFSQYAYAEWLRSGSERNSYSVGYNPRYWLNQTYYAFGESEFRVDGALGIDREIKLVTGLGGQFINTPEQGLHLELGVGGRSIEFDNVDDASNEALSLARLGYFRTFADSIKFDLSVSSSRSSEEISEANGEVGLSLRIPNGVIRLAYRSRYLKVGEQDTFTDDDTFVSFGYSF